MSSYFAPGRVNLIGEHLDYNGGLVLPTALTIGIKAIVTKRNNGKILLRSASHAFSKEIDLDDIPVFDPANDWTNYPIGVISLLKKEGYEIPSCEIYYESNLPEGSGLSSSAAIEILTSYAIINEVRHATMHDSELVWLANFCRQVENEFIGVKCGIMDQYAVALGKKDNAILINCATLEHRYIPIELDGYSLVIMNTKKPRSLIHSKYNERKAECEAALSILHTVLPDIQHLCDAEMHHLDLITDEVLKRRARHVISENLRVKESIKALRYNDLTTLGRLLNASHTSLKNDYEVTGIELDTLAEEAQQVKGCLGARMTGAGFGGCAIAIVQQSMLEEFKNAVAAKYVSVTGIQCEIYETHIGNGVGKI